MKKTLGVFFVCSLLGAGFELAAQELTTPPPVLRIFREDVKEGKEEATLLTINPKMSYVSKEFAAGDPDFWTPKLARAARPASKGTDKSDTK